MNRITETRTRLDLSPAEMARYLGVSPFTLRNWEREQGHSGHRAMPPVATRLLDVLATIEALNPDLHRVFINQSKGGNGK